VAFLHRSVIHRCAVGDLSACFQRESDCDLGCFTGRKDVIMVDLGSEDKAGKDPKDIITDRLLERCIFITQMTVGGTLYPDIRREYGTLTITMVHRFPTGMIVRGVCAHPDSLKDDSTMHFEIMFSTIAGPREHASPVVLPSR